MNANKQDAGGEVTNPDNVGGLVWYVCTSCLLMVQLPSDTPTLGRCQCSPKGWSLRRAKLPSGYELCRAAPAGGAPESLVKWERDYDDTHLAPYCREDVKRLLADWRASIAAPAGGDDLYRQACDSVEEWKARALEAEADIARIHAQINAENGPTFMGEPVVSAPAWGEPNGKLVGWWNGITPGFDGMGMPSIRWGADAEDSRHDIPLYDGYNPIHYVTPVSAPAGGRPYGGDPAEPRDDSDRYDSAPAGSGEVDGLARWWQAVEDDMMRDGLSHPDHHVVVRYVGKHERADLTAGDIRAALLRKLQQGADYVMVPRDSAKMVTHVCSEWIDLFRDAPGIEKYERYSYEPAVEELRDEYAAIAASQGQEGGENG